MTQDEIIEMARQAGIEKWWDSGNEQREVLQEHLEAFAKLVAAKEREECAKVCEVYEWGNRETYAAEQCAKAIRARSISRGEA